MPLFQCLQTQQIREEPKFYLFNLWGAFHTVMVPEHWNGYAVSQNVLKLIPANADIAGYIYIFLNTDVGKTLITRQTYGSVVDMIDNNSLEVVEFPLLKNRDVQSKINQIALLANDLRYQAYCKEKEALDIMNNEILGDTHP